MRKQGTVVRWEAERGFGFIRCPPTQDVFFHVKDFRSSPSVVPQLGMLVDFDEIQIGGRGPRAMTVRPVGARPVPSLQPRNGPTKRRGSNRRSGGLVASGAWIALPLMLAYAGFMVYAVLTRNAPLWVLPASLGINLAAFFAYWQDKYAAENRKWRTPEDTLHFWSLAGGWAGAWFAQQVLRHKSKKESFRAAYWLTVVMHCAAAGYVAYRQFTGSPLF
jgi:uncharacterized membrane protein YsdA (DUF1294 family)/cold shock CspA family protein